MSPGSAMALLACTCALACSGGDDTGAAPSHGRAGHDAGDDRLVLPEDLPNTEQGAESGGLTLVAWTLEFGANGPEYYAAVRNDGAEPACEAGMQTYFYDTAGLMIASAGTALLGGRPHRIEDGSGALLFCIEPGATSMAAVTEFTDGFALEALSALEHRFPAFPLSIAVPNGALAASGVKVVAEDGRRHYTGTFRNELASAVRDPSVAVFSTNRVGRPLAVATASAGVVVAPGGTWTFDTSSVDDVGGYVVYAAAKLAP